MLAETGEGAPDVELLVRDNSLADVGESAVEWRCRSDSGGRFELIVGAATVVDIEITRTGLVPRRIPFVAVRGDLEILVDTARRLLITVLLDEHGDGLALRPLRHARCEVVVGAGDRRKRVIVHGTTDDSGQLVVDAHGDQIFFVVYPAGALPFGDVFELEDRQEQLKVVVPPAGEVTGRVVDARSRLPLAGARLSEIGNQELNVVTGGDGTFRLPHKDRALWRLEHAGYTTKYVDIPARRAGSPQLPDISLDSTVALVGRTSGFTSPVRVQAISQQAWYVHNRWQQCVQTTTGEDIRFGEAPAAEEILVQASDTNGHRGTARVGPGVPGAVLDFGSLQPQRLASLHGRVIAADSGGEPVLVRLELRIGDVLTHDRTIVPRGGEYRAEGLLPGTASIWLVCGDTSTEAQELVLTAGGDHAVDLDLGGWIRGECRDRSGKGIRNAHVCITNIPATVMRPTYAITDRYGRFACAGLDRANTHTVEVIDAGRGRSSVPLLMNGVLPGGPALQFLVLPNRFTIRGRVDAALLASIPARELFVLATSALGRAGEARVAPTGEFVLSTDDPGPYRLELCALDVSGESLETTSTNANPIENVAPGDADVVFRAGR